MKLEPISLQVEFAARSPIDATEWSRILGRFLQGIAVGCVASKKDVIIGHIKGLALLPGGGYLRASVVGSTLPPECEGSSSEDVSEILASINVIVYGLDSVSLRQIVSDEAKSCSSQSEIQAAVKVVAEAHRHAHDNN